MKTQSNARIIKTVSAENEMHVYFEDANKHFLCHDLEDAFNIASYLGYKPVNFDENTIYFI